MIQRKYSATNRCVQKHIYNNIKGLINGCIALIRYSPEICELSRVINHKTEDFISTPKVLGQRHHTLSTCSPGHTTPTT